MEELCRQGVQTRFIKINDTADQMLALVNAHLQQNLGSAEVLVKSLPFSDATTTVEEMKDEFVRQVRDQVHEHAVAELERSLRRISSTKILCRRVARRIRGKRPTPQISQGDQREVKVLQNVIHAVMSCMSNTSLLEHGSLQQACCSFVAIVARSQTFREVVDHSVIAAKRPDAKGAIEMCMTVWNVHRHDVEVLKSAARALSVLACSGTLLYQHVGSEGVELILDTIACSSDGDRGAGHAG